VLGFNVPPIRRSPAITERELWMNRVGTGEVTYGPKHMFPAKAVKKQV